MVMAGRGSGTSAGWKRWPGCPSQRAGRRAGVGVTSVAQHASREGARIRPRIEHDYSIDDGRDVTLRPDDVATRTGREVLHEPCARATQTRWIEDDEIGRGALAEDAAIAQPVDDGRDH